jgi:alpha-D-ribose 1-methylphosphonate 5-triphosphate diphosphatase
VFAAVASSILHTAADAGGMRQTLVGGTVLVGDRLIPDTTLSIDGGRITTVGAAVGTSAAVAVHNLLVLPGLIDLHADAIERAIEPRPGVRMPLPAALMEHDGWLLASGITTCFLSLTDGFEPGLRSRELLRSLIETLRSQKVPLKARTPVHLRREVCAPGDPDEVVAWLATRQVHLLSLNDHLPSGDDPGQEARFVASLRRRLNGRGSDLESLIAEARNRRSSGLAIRERLCHAARAHDVPVAAHDDASPDQAEASAARGVAISEFPADLATARRARQLGSRVLLGAPNVVRGGSHVGWLGAADAVAAGACDALCSDYHPPCLFQAPFILAERGVCDLASGWNLASRGPALAAGLHDHGRLEAGCVADLVLVEPGPVPRVRSVYIAGREVARYL